MKAKWFFAALCLVMLYPSVGLASPGRGSFHLHRKLRKPFYKSQSGNLKLYYGGYAQGDAMAVDNAPQLLGRENLRAARFATAVDFYENWRVEVSYDFADHRLYNAYLNYKGWNPVIATVGQFSPVFGLSNTSYTPALTMLELALPVFAFSPPYVPGAQIGIVIDPVTLYASFTGPSLGSTVHGHNPYAGVISLSFSPIHTLRRVFTLTLSGWKQGTDSFHTKDFFAAPGVESRNLGGLIGTGNVGNIKNYQVIDAGMGTVYGSFSAQGEYVSTWVNRINAFPRLHFSGYYLLASYFLTGESRRYDFREAGFVGISPIRHKYGAWQIAVRYGELNLIDHNVMGGHEQDITVGLSWYPSQHFKLMLNYIRAIATPNNCDVNQSSNFYVFRLQILL